MESDRFIEALGTPEEWSRITPETVAVEAVPDEVVTDANLKNKIGSVATKEEVDRALLLLKQD